MPDTEVDSWIDRMAKDLADDSTGVTLGQERVKLALEAAAEMKCVGLKIMLARCYELMAESESSDTKVNLEEGFMGQVKALIE